VIDADVLARAGEVFDLHPLRPVEPAQLALRRACVRRGGAVIDGNRYLRRLISLARWAFPDVWNGFRGSLPTAVAVLDRWPHLAGFYHQLMTEHGHCHTQACVAVARKLVERTWTVLHRGTPYQIRDLDGQPISRPEAQKMIKQVCTVPDHVRAKARAHSAARNRAKLTR
jgi:hypothetical protein